MTNLKEIEFALKNGHTNVRAGIELDGTPFVVGTFGYIATSNNEEYNAMIQLISQYVTIDNPLHESKIEKVETFKDRLEKLFGEKYVIKNKKIKEALNNKLIECTYMKPNGVKIYLFKVEGLEITYNLSGTIMANGSYWIKEGRFRY